MQAQRRLETAASTDYDFTEQVGHLLRRAYQRHVAVFQQLIPDSRLTGAQFCVLCALRDFGAISMSEIGRITAIDQATVRGILERLRARDLVGIAADDADRRKVIVSLQPAGQTLLQEVIPAAQRISEDTVAGLNVAERLALQFLLKKLSGDSGDEPSGSATVEPSAESVKRARRRSSAAPPGRARA